MLVMRSGGYRFLRPSFDKTKEAAIARGLFLNLAPEVGLEPTTP